MNPMFMKQIVEVGVSTMPQIRLENIPGERLDLPESSPPFHALVEVFGTGSIFV